MYVYISAYALVFENPNVYIPRMNRSTKLNFGKVNLVKFSEYVKQQSLFDFCDFVKLYAVVQILWHFQLFDKRLISLLVLRQITY